MRMLNQVILEGNVDAWKMHDKTLEISVEWEGESFIIKCFGRWSSITKKKLSCDGIKRIRVVGQLHVDSIYSQHIEFLDLK